MIEPDSPLRPVWLHVGCGSSPLPGWVNLDVQILPGVDVVADVTSGLAVRRASAVFAEHFLEHLPVERALAFLEEAHGVLADDGWIRLSTPNLEWVLATQYRESHGSGADRGALDINRAFYGWEHRFLWDRWFLGRALEACGFEHVRWPGYGESSLPAFQGIERHPRDPDLPGIPHVLIVEARKGPPRREALESLRRELEDDFLLHLEEAGLRQARREIARLRLKNEAAERTIAAMQASRFWKMRNVWFRFKRATGLTRDP